MLLRNCCGTGVVLAVLGLPIISAIASPVGIVSVSPAADKTVGTAFPDFILRFSAPINIATATADSVRLYRLGEDDPTPGPDDTIVPTGLIFTTSDGLIVAFNPAEALADGQYAIVVYGTQTTRSGPGNGLDFSHDVVTYDTEAFKTLGDEFTLEAWTRWDRLPLSGSNSYGAIFDVGQTGRNVPGFSLSHHGSIGQFYFRLPDGTTGVTEAPGAFTIGKWQHIAGVSSPEGLKLYVGGNLVATTPEVIRPIDFAENIEVALGGYSRWAGAYDYIDAFIDELRVWNVARGQEEIRRTMYTPLAGDEPGLLVYHPLDEADGATLVDETGHGFHGARGGAARLPSDAPLIEMAAIALAGADSLQVDVDGDGAPGGVLISRFTVDATAPRVVSLDPDPTTCELLLSLGSLSIGFDDEMNAKTLIAATASLIASGGDGVFGNGNDVNVLLTDPTYDATLRVATFAFASPLPDEFYRFTLSDSVQSITGASLDGEQPGLGGVEAPLPSGDGLAGGDFVMDFEIRSSQDCNENGVPDECELRSGPTVPPPGAIRNPDNGHHYLLTNPSTWAEAEVQAVSMGGHLATIRSADENQWLFDTFLPQTGANQVFIGCSDLVVEGQWVWTSGEPMTYTNWAPGQPDNVNNEGVGELTLRSVNCCQATTWNDRVESTVLEGIVEVIGDNDCNDNGTLDECEIADGKAGDCNANGVPDECELDGNDCNNDATPDDCEPDCNGNGIPDTCDLDAGAADCNNNGLPDECEIAGGGSALDFDGSDDWVRIPRTPLLEPTDELTIEVWIRADSIGSTNNSRIVRIANSFGAGYILSWRQSGSSKLELRIDSASGGACRATDPTPVTTYFGQWIHVAGVYSATQDICKLYVDGELKADKPAVGTLRYSGSDLFIGNHVESGEDFDGLIDEVRIWNVARTASEIMDAKDDALLGDEAGLVGYWRFNETEGQIAFDSSPHGHDGMLGANADPLGDGRDPQWSSEGAPITERDCNLNNVLDECDISEGTSGDCNANGLPDECEPDVDCNTNGVQDICDIASGESSDCNENSTPDDCELVDNDCDANGVPDECEDCNGNGLSDACDLEAGTSENCNGNAIPDECEPDCNANGIADECDIRDDVSNDFDLNGVPDECQPDCNNNGFPDFIDIAFAFSPDCNINSVPDECDLDTGDSTDCNTNGVPDECDIADAFSGDCDCDHLPDECQSDADLDGIPDTCDQYGDFDHDGGTELDDFDIFSLCLDLSGPGIIPPFFVCLDVFDSDASDTVDLRDAAAFQRSMNESLCPDETPVP